MSGSAELTSSSKASEAPFFTSNDAGGCSAHELAVRVENIFSTMADQQGEVSVEKLTLKP